MASTPSWMEQGKAGGTSSEGANRAGNGAEGPGNAQAGVEDSNTVRFIFRVTALALGVMMLVSSVIELLNLSSATGFFIALFNILFASVLILYEAQGFYMCDEVDSGMRRYFGLMYGHMGRAIFIIFIAFLNFAMTDAGWVAILTGFLLLALGGIMILIYLKYPHLLDEPPGLGDVKQAAPPRGYAPPPNMPSTSL